VVEAIRARHNSAERLPFASDANVLHYFEHYTLWKQKKKKKEKKKKAAGTAAAAMPIEAAPTVTTVQAAAAAELEIRLRKDVPATILPW
jgi:hypothetical protein